jgi:acyl-coenzyme A thioesterase PaaI-like protein
MDSLQQHYAPRSRCFGCGPANEQGLHIRSFVAESGEIVARWSPQPHHLAFEGVLNGGICATLLDCHANWTAAYHIMGARGLDAPPTTVTATFELTLSRPTPMDQELVLRARAEEVTPKRALIEATLEAGGEVTSRLRGTFVAVKAGHPAFGSW